MGGDGNDTINGGNDNDYIEGNADNDSLLGGDGLDTFLGGAGNDTILGGADVDSLIGDAGSDSLLGDGGADILQGFATAEVAGLATTQIDTLTGGSGADTFVFGLAGGLGYIGQAGYVLGAALTDGVIINNFGVDGDIFRITQNAVNPIDEIQSVGSGIYELQETGANIATYRLDMNTAGVAYLQDSTGASTYAVINKDASITDVAFLNTVTNLATWNIV